MSNSTKSDKEKKKVEEEKMKKTKGLDEQDVKILIAYAKDLYGEKIKNTKAGIDELMKNINVLAGVKDTSTGLSHPSCWDFAADAMLIKEHYMRVARITSIIPNLGQWQGRCSDCMSNPKPKRSESENLLVYGIQIKQGQKYITKLDESLADIDVNDTMRVAVHHTTYVIKLPLPMKISKTVKLMEVEDKPDVTYADIGGCKEQIKKLREVIEMPLTHPKRFTDLGVEPPRGVLLTGPPGMGKTLCARAVANRTDACFIRVIGSELAQKYIGEGAALVRDLFEYAKTKPAAIMFFDEIDAVGQSRSHGELGDNEAGRTLMELIVQLDGFSPRGNIKVLMATNRADTLDPALLRPGRLDRKIEFGPPDFKGRQEIFKIHARQMSVTRDIRYELLARLCPQASGADIRSICTEAGMFAIRERKKVCSEREFLKAIDKVVRGDKRFSALHRYLTHN